MILIPLSLAAIGGTTSLCHPPTGVALLRRRHRPTDDHSSRRCSKSRSELYEVEEEHTEYTDSTYEEQSSQHGSKYNDNYNDDDDKNDDVYYHGSDDEFNNDLESRIEGFIDKVIKGWKEEFSN
ncbi:unnamed protein product [Camellia sinensis]